SIGEMDTLQVAGDSRPNLDALHRLEAAYVIVPVADLPDERLRDRHRGGSRWLRLAASRTRGEHERRQRRQKTNVHASRIPEKDVSLAAMQRQQVMTRRYSCVQLVSTPVDIATDGLSRLC